MRKVKKMQKGGSLEKEAIAKIKQMSKNKPVSKEVGMNPSIREVPGSFKPYTSAQKDSLMRRWKAGKFKTGGKMKKK